MPKLCGITFATPLPVVSQTKVLGVVGLTFGQTARLNVLYPAPPAPVALAIRCTASLSILDSTGKVLRSAPVFINPGSSQSLDFNLDTAPTPTDSRLEVYARVTSPASELASANPVALPACNLIPTLELLDNATKKTILVLSNAERVFPQPVPASGK
jgi:hypothetical protein